jgi:hypothetical protein
MPPGAAVSEPSRDDLRREWRTTILSADDTRLRRLLSARPELADPSIERLEQLAELVMSLDLLSGWLQFADRTVRTLAAGLCLLPAVTTAERLAALFGRTAADIAAPLDRMEAAGIVLLGPGRLVRNPALALAIRTPFGLGRPAASLLGAQTVSVLGEIARALGVHPSGPKVTKAVLVAALEAGLGDRELLERVVAAGPAGTRELVGRLAAGRAQIAVSGSGPFFGRGSRPTDPTDWLFRHGLLVSPTWGLGEMPREVALAWRGGRVAELPEVPQLDAVAVDVEVVDRQVAERALALVDAATAVIEAFGEEPAKALQAGGLGVRELRRLARLVALEETAAARVVELLGLAALLTEEDGLVLPTPAADRWLDRDPPAAWVELVRAWWTSLTHLSEAGRPGLDGKVRPALAPTPPTPQALMRRAVVARLLGSFPLGAGPRPGELAAFLAWAHPAVWEGGPVGPETVLDWSVSEPVELGLATPEGALGRAGRRLLGLEPGDPAEVVAAFAPPVAGELVVQADLTAVLPGRPDRALRQQLELLADVESTGAATVYRFSEASLRRGFDAGWDAAAILRFLGERAVHGLPQPLTYLIEDLGRRYGRLRVGAVGSYVRSDDPTLLAEVVRTRRLGRLGLRLLAETVAVSALPAGALEAALREAGFLAAEEEPSGGLVVRRPVARRSGPRRVLRGVDPREIVLPTLTAELRLVDPDDGAASERPAAVTMVARPDLEAAIVRLRGDGPAPQPAADRPAAPDDRPGGGRREREDLEVRGELDAELGELLAALEELTPPRPVAIAHGTDTRSLCAYACEQDWPVRLAWRGPDGRERQTDAFVDMVQGEKVLFEDAADGRAFVVPADQLVWVRVLQEAEEEERGL